MECHRLHYEEPMKSTGLLLWTASGFLFCTSLFADNGKLKVMGYNIHGWEPSQEKLQEIITKSGAEVVGLAEAWDAKQNLAFAAKIKYQVIFGGMDTPNAVGAEPSWDVGGFYMPATLLSKHPIL
jgi:hypothetical protein